MLQIIAVITIANIISVLSTWRNACLFGALIAGTTASAQSRFNFQEPVTEVARQQYDLHLLILYIIVAIGVGVFAVMLYSIIYHRKAAGHTAAKFHENTVVEIGWTVIPFFIIMAMAFPATKVILNAKDTSAADLTIKVVGYQWKWSYDYLDDNVFFYSTLTTPEEQIGPLLSKTYGVPPADTVRDENYLLEVDNPMVVPVGRKVRVLLTAADVIHSWWVPQLGVKQDAVPGLVREAWFEIEREGIFRGQCAELCGKNHGFMPVVVHAVSVDEYADWVASQGGGTQQLAADTPVAVGDVQASIAPVATTAEPAVWDMESVMAYGEETYVTHCAACHQVNGQGLEPAFPSLVGSPIVVGALDDHIDQILQGITGTAMASFAYLSDAEIAAIITYERNAWGNSVGDLTTVANVEARR